MNNVTENLDNVLKRIGIDIDQERFICISEITKLVCKYFDVPFEKVFIKTRKREVVMVRQISMYFSSIYTEDTLKNISDYFKLNQHTIVIHSSDTVENDMQTDDEYKEHILTIKTVIEIVYKCQPVKRKKRPN